MPLATDVLPAGSGDRRSTDEDDCGADKTDDNGGNAVEAVRLWVEDAIDESEPLQKQNAGATEKPQKGQIGPLVQFMNPKSQSDPSS